MTANIYDLPTPLEDEEQFTRLIPDRGVLIERIVSTGQATGGIGGRGIGPTLNLFSLTSRFCRSILSRKPLPRHQR